MLLITHPTGNTFVRALLVALEQADELGSFQTTVVARASDSYVRLIPQTLRKELLRRTYDIPNSKVSTRPLKELVRLVASKSNINFLTAHETGWASIDSVYRDLDRYVAKQLPVNLKYHQLSAVYCYEDAAFHTFKAAKQLGLKCFYDLPIAYWETSQQLLREEAERLPEWEPTLVGTRDSPAKLQRKTEELDLADVVICPSNFVYDSLPTTAHQTKKCVVAEFGSPEISVQTQKSRDFTHSPLRLLFAGSMTQRKGLSDLFTAMKLLNRSNVELVVMGSLLMPMEFYRTQLPDFTYEPTRPHQAVLQLMQSCDILVLPSIVEGRALVQQEAMSCGLPLIVTPNAGGEDLVDEGKTGFLVPIRSPQKIAEKIAWFADNHHRLEEMSALALQKAAQITWNNYCQKILNVVQTSKRARNTNVINQTIRNIQRLIWLYFWLLIFEGALRKWVAPQLAAPLLIIRDPVVIGAYFLALKAGLFPKDIFTKIIIFLAFISFLGGLATVITSDSNITVAVIIFGIRTNFLHLPLIFLLTKVFNLDDVKNLGRWVLLLAVPMAILMVYQFSSPPDAFINRGAGIGAEQLGAALGKIRPAGTFSFITGAAQYLTLVASFLVYGLLQSKIYPYWLLSAAGLSLVLALAVSGSRTALTSVGLVVLSLLTILLIKPSLAGKSYKFLLLASITSLGMNFVPSFNQGIEVLNARVENANTAEASSGGIVGRFLDGFLAPFNYVDQIPPLGYGLGMGTNVGAVLLTGETQFLLPEGEWGRVIFESGLVLGVLYILLRIALVGWMGGFCIKSAAAENSLPLLLFGSCGIQILNGQFSRSSDIGFAVLGAGLCLASAKSMFNNSKQPDEDFTSRQLLN